MATVRITRYAAALALAAALLPLRGRASTDCDVTWDAGADREARLRFTIEQGTPVVRELAIHPRGSGWRVLAADARPEFRIVSGIRRMSNQQIQPLRELGVELTPAIVDE